MVMSFGPQWLKNVTEPPSGTATSTAGGDARRKYTADDLVKLYRRGQPPTKGVLACSDLVAPEQLDPMVGMRMTEEEQAAMSSGGSFTSPYRGTPPRMSATTGGGDHRFADRQLSVPSPSGSRGTNFGFGDDREGGGSPRSRSYSQEGNQHQRRAGSSWERGQRQPTPQRGAGGFLSSYERKDGADRTGPHAFGEPSSGGRGDSMEKILWDDVPSHSDSMVGSFTSDGVFQLGGAPSNTEGIAMGSLEDEAEPAKAAVAANGVGGGFGGMGGSILKVITAGMQKGDEQQQQRSQENGSQLSSNPGSRGPASVEVDDFLDPPAIVAPKQIEAWYYKDNAEVIQGPFPGHTMAEWHKQGFFESSLQVRGDDGPFVAIADLNAEYTPAEIFLSRGPMVKPSAQQASYEHSSLSDAASAAQAGSDHYVAAQNAMGEGEGGVATSRRAELEMHSEEGKVGGDGGSPVFSEEAAVPGPNVLHTPLTQQQRMQQQIQQHHAALQQQHHHQQLMHMQQQSHPGPGGQGFMGGMMHTSGLPAMQHIWGGQGLPDRQHVDQRQQTMVSTSQVGRLPSMDMAAPAPFHNGWGGQQQAGLGSSQMAFHQQNFGDRMESQEQQQLKSDHQHHQQQQQQQQYQMRMQQQYQMLMHQSQQQSQMQQQHSHQQLLEQEQLRRQQVHQQQQQQQQHFNQQRQQQQPQQELQQATRVPQQDHLRTQLQQQPVPQPSQEQHVTSLPSMTYNDQDEPDPLNMQELVDMADQLTGEDTKPPTTLPPQAAIKEPLLPIPTFPKEQPLLEKPKHESGDVARQDTSGTDPAVAVAGGERRPPASQGEDQDATAKKHNPLEIRKRSFEKPKKGKKKKANTSTGSPPPPGPGPAGDGDVVKADTKPVEIVAASVAPVLATSDASEWGNISRKAKPKSLFDIQREEEDARALKHQQMERERRLRAQHAAAAGVPAPQAAGTWAWGARSAAAVVSRNPPPSLVASMSSPPTQHIQPTGAAVVANTPGGPHIIRKQNPAQAVQHPMAAAGQPSETRPALASQVAAASRAVALEQWCAAALGSKTNMDVATFVEMISQINNLQEIAELCRELCQMSGQKASEFAGEFLARRDGRPLVSHDSDSTRPSSDQFQSVSKKRKKRGGVK